MWSPPPRVAHYSSPLPLLTWLQMWLPGCVPLATPVLLTSVDTEPSTKISRHIPLWWPDFSAKRLVLFNYLFVNCGLTAVSPINNVAYS